MSQPKKNDELKTDSQAEELTPMGFTTAKEVEQEDQIRKLEHQLNILSSTLSKVAKKTGVKAGIDAQNGDYFGFLRCIDGDPCVSWKMLPGSYVNLNEFGQIIDLQVMEVTCLSGAVHKMAYNEFDKRTQNSQVHCKIFSYASKNDVGEWRAKRFGHDDMMKLQLSTDGGTTYDGQLVEVPLYAIN